jgi:glycerol-3-phosphate dehydrogenase
VGANVSFGKRSLVIDHAASHGVEGLVTAVTNRFTTARGVAARSVDLATRKLGRRLPPCRSDVTPLFGAPSQDVSQLARELIRRSDLQLDSAAGERLARNHGTNGSSVLQLIRETPGLAERLGPSGTLAAEVLYATRHELASRLADCVFRRTDLGTSGNPGEPTLRRCAQIMAAELGWGPAELERELAEVRTRFCQRS